ncbi:DJ-1/PfpI family protein [Sphingomonas sp. DT-204]|uniref:DJ-1/PfpI family protein n=1 Tax=Sphingomonas sp. DT-204 TaxID=3396166 RepID=UPI003F1A2D2F
MNKRLIWGALGTLSILAAIGGSWIASLPPAPAAAAPPPPIAAEETAATLAALEPPKRRRPLIAIVGINDATETTDYLMPYGILRRSGVADVIALATGPGPVMLYPALKVEPQATVAAFDARHPAGADYVIVPAMSRDDDPAALRWIRIQAAKGAIVIGVCAGAKVVAAAGLLDGKRATTHWYYLKELRERHPAIRYVPDRRLVVDGKVATTTGITASIPMSLTLIEAIGGRDRAAGVARDLGITEWDVHHRSAAFRFNRSFALTVIGNRLAFHEVMGLELRPGVDEVSLALVADAWSRTYRSRAETFSAAPGPQATREGLHILPDRVAAEWPGAGQLISFEGPPAEALDNTLRDISARYGTRTGDLVAMQLEYPRKPADQQIAWNGDTLATRLPAPSE